MKPQQANSENCGPWAHNQMTRLKNKSVQYEHSTTKTGEGHE